MDPGIGLIVNSMVPSEPGVPKLRPKSTLQLPDGFCEKPHVRYALKYMTDPEQRERALEVAMAWKQKFATGNWKSVIAAIEAARKEDKVRSVLYDAEQDHVQSPVHLAMRPRAMTAASAPAVPQASPQSVSWPAGLTRQHTASASLSLRRTPRTSMPRACRWDVITSGPVTPLSPMPLGNSFSGNGFWTTPPTQIEEDEVSTLVPDTETEPTTLTAPSDPEACKAYTTVKDEIDSLARKYCLERLHTLASDAYLPPTMIKRKDVLDAATTVLHDRSVMLKTALIEDLPAKLRCRAAEEVALRRELCIKDELELSEQNDWMNNETLMPVPKVHDSDKQTDYVSPPIHLVVSILDEQREAIRMFRKQRGSSDLELGGIALEAAWALRVLEDAEDLVAAEGDGLSSVGDEDEGYSYSNFMRSIRSELSISSSSEGPASTVDNRSNTDLTSLRSRSNTQNTFTSIRSRDFRFFQRSSTSPPEEVPILKSFHESKVSNSSNENGVSLRRRSALHRSTSTTSEIPSSEVSPEDREFRHRGPSLVDLDNWAEELKKMETMRADRQRSSASHCRIPRREYNQSGSANNSRATDFQPSRSYLSFSSASSSSEQPKSLFRSPYDERPISQLSSGSGSVLRPATPDHEHRQRNLSEASFKTNSRDTSKVSLHDSVRRPTQLNTSITPYIFHFNKLIYNWYGLPHAGAASYANHKTARKPIANMVNWTADKDQIILVGIFKFHDIKNSAPLLNYLTKEIGDGCTPKAVSHRLSNLRKSGKPVGSTTTPKKASVARAPRTPASGGRASAKKSVNKDVTSDESGGEEAVPSPLASRKRTRTRTPKTPPKYAESDATSGDDDEGEEEFSPVVKKVKTEPVDDEVAASTALVIAPSASLEEEEDEDEDEGVAFI
ncbi:hypothetical protein C7974DRAFT_457382 [Boeremia exigua]|uniref:uncharacterized protein n=1 Tax=Boeremia exigua TaxID=749465 RepID=UPI001E8DD071|nr:uncharacterized protein C7974DRAFT_457382 [Boeremia exigua]KAH6622330.1 hypothetical protein C7974DRAFT_457382 [Boeremia exigua]